MIKVVFLICLFFSLCKADYVYFKDGESVKTEILDTIGCKIKIRRNGNLIDIEKKWISYLICKTDSISYKDFICTPEIANKKSNITFEDGFNNDKVTAIVKRLSFDKTINRNCTLFYTSEPLNGNEYKDCWGDKFKIFVNKLKEKYGNVKEVNNEEMYKLLKGNSDTNCILIPFQTKFGYVDTKKTIGGISERDMMANYKNSSGALVSAVVNIKIIDLKSKKIIFDDTSSYRKSIPGFAFVHPNAENIAEVKCNALENALLNSIDKTRRIITKIFEIRFTPLDVLP